MSSYLLTPQAEDDLFSVWSYIAQDNIEAADRVEAQIYAACGFWPPLRRPGMSATTLQLGLCVSGPCCVSKLFIVYDPASSPLRIIRILHGALDIPGHLTE
jgi:plasmid stabilization system protein ParE